MLWVPLLELLQADVTVAFQLHHRMLFGAGANLLRCFGQPRLDPIVSYEILLLLDICF